MARLIALLSVSCLLTTTYKCRLTTIKLARDSDKDLIWLARFITMLADHQTHGWHDDCPGHQEYTVKIEESEMQFGQSLCEVQPCTAVVYAVR